MRKPDPNDPRFQYVLPAPQKQALLCKLDNGALYEFPIEALSVAENWDGSGLTGVKVIEDGTAALVRLRSGATLDFPVDFVLHHCEPRYAFHKSKVRPSSIGDTVRRLREERRLTLAQLARKTGIAEPNLSRLEHGKHSPMLGTLHKLAKALDVPVRELLSA